MKIKSGSPFESPAKRPIPAVRFWRLLKLLTIEFESSDFPTLLFIIKSRTFPFGDELCGALVFRDKFKGASSASFAPYDEPLELRFKLS